MNIKRAGCCTKCDTPVFEIRTKYGDGPLKDFPRQLGSPLPTAHRIDYVLADNSTTHMTSCETCVPEMIDPQSFPGIWQKVMETFAFDLDKDVLVAMGGRPRTPKQQEAVEQFVQQQAQNHILCVVAVSKWSEILG